MTTERDLEPRVIAAAEGINNGDPLRDFLNEYEVYEVVEALARVYRSSGVTTDQERGTLPLGQPHPAAEAALAWFRNRPVSVLLQWQEAFASTALEGNFAAEVCGETLRRLLEGEPVSDRYLLGLVWVMREGTE